MRPHLHKTTLVFGEPLWACSLTGTKTTYFPTAWGAFRKWQILNGVEEWTTKLNLKEDYP